jgi:hypothetical protein
MILVLLLVTASALAGLFAIALMRAAAFADRQMATPSAPTEAWTLALRVRRAVARWPLTELDPVERSTFADAIAEARDFDDLDPTWQELIIAAERGSRPRSTKEAHDLTRSP